MRSRIQPSLLAALAALLIVPAAALGILGVSTGTSQAGNDHDSWQVHSFMERAFGGDGAFLGVHLTEESDLETGGARVTTVVPDSAADKAGIEAGDVIVEVDGKRVSGPMGLSELVGSKSVGDRVDLTIVRDEREFMLDAELGERESGFRVMGIPESFRHLDCDDDDDDCSFSFNFECEGDDCEGFSWQMPDFGRKPLLGVQLVEMTPELRIHMGADDDEGVLVSRVVEESAAKDGGIEVGDVIVSVDDRRIEDVDDLRRALSRRAGERIDIDVVREGVTMTLYVTLPEAEEFDRSMMRLPQSLRSDIVNSVRQALSEAEVELGRLRFDQADAMTEARRALEETRKAQREASEAAAEAVRQAARSRNST